MAPRNFKVQYFNDFTGGLNNKTQSQGLALNESPDCADVDFNARGGFSCRRGFQTTFTAASLNDVVNDRHGYIEGQFVAGGVEVLYGFDAAQDFWTYTAGGTLTIDTATPNNADPGVPIRAAAWGTKLYFANWIASGTWYMKSWNGTTFTGLTHLPNNDYTAPTTGNAPQAKLVANHSGHIFWAHTREGGVEFPSRVRFSHPLQPECFADADFFDIDPDDSDIITAIVPFKDQILVFKRRAVYAIFGYDRESFVVERLSNTAGVSCPRAVDANSGICYWWSVDGNVFAYNGRGIVPVGERISGVTDQGVVAGCDTNAVCWASNRLYVSLRMVDDQRNTFVYDPAVGENGAWTRYTVFPTTMIWWRTADTSKNGLFFHERGSSSVRDFNNPDNQVDNINGTDTPIAAYYRTAWFVSGDSGLTKRWRRPHVTVACNDPARLQVDVFHNYVESTFKKRLFLDVGVAGSGGDLVWEAASGPAVGGDWGETWASEGDVTNYEFSRLSSLGRSNAVQLRFEMKNHQSKWWVDSFTIPFLEKTYR